MPRGTEAAEVKSSKDESMWLAAPSPSRSLPMNKTKTKEPNCSQFVFEWREVFFKRKCLEIFYMAPLEKREEKACKANCNICR